MMLSRGSSQLFTSGLTESHCPRCLREGELPFGSICRSCGSEVARRATRLARWVSLATTAAVGLYAFLSLGEDRASRMVGGAAVLMWYVFTYAAVRRAARLLLK